MANLLTSLVDPSAWFWPGVISLLVFAARKGIASAITDGIRHDFAVKLKSVGHEFDLKLEKTRAEIRAEEDRLSATRTAALASVTSGASALSQRRLEAAEEVVKALQYLSPGVLVAEMWARVDAKKLAANREQAGVQRMIEFYKKQADTVVEGLKAHPLPPWTRLHLTPKVWALFGTYSMIVIEPTVEIQALWDGVPSQILRKEVALREATEAMPERAEEFARLGARGLPSVASDLYDRLLAELRSCVSGSDAEAMARFVESAEVLAKSELARKARIEAGIEPVEGSGGAEPR